MEEKDLKDIKGQFSEVVKENIEPLSKKIDEHGEALKKAEEKISKLEDAPQKGINLAQTTGGKYKGYNLNRQADAIKRHAEKNPHAYETFCKGGKLDEEKIDNYSKWCIDFINAKVHGNVESMQALQKASYAEGADATGGYVVPIEYQWDMVQLARNKAFAINECTVIPMSGDSLKLPSEATLASGTWEGEADTIASGEGTFGQVSLTAKKYASLATLSNELLADQAVDIVSILTEQLSYDTLVNGLDNQVLNGDGTTFTGLLDAGSSNEVTLAGTTFASIDADDLSVAISKLSQGDLENAKWVLNPLIKHYLRILKDSNNAYIFQRPEGGLSATAWELPIIESAKAPSTTAVDTSFVVLGNLKKYYIGQRKGLVSLDVDPYGLFSTDQTRFRMTSRWGLASSRASAFCKITTAAS